MILINTKETQQITLHLPVPLTNPASLSEPTDYLQFNELFYRSNHIKGFAVNDMIFVQQVDASDKKLETKNLVEHTILYAFNNQGQLA